MTKQFCTFFVDNLFFGVEVLKVQEVIRYQEMTPVPLSPTMIQGLINLRGQIVTAIDLRCRLELSPRDAEQLPLNVVVRSDDGAVNCGKLNWISTGHLATWKRSFWPPVRKWKH